MNYHAAGQDGPDRLATEFTVAPLRVAAGGVGSAVVPTGPARLSSPAPERRSSISDDASSELARRAAARAVDPFTPGQALTTYCTWFITVDRKSLVVVVPTGHGNQALDEILAHALAWQQDRELLLVVPADTANAFLHRLAWVATRCAVATYDENLTVQQADSVDRQAVLDNRATLPVNRNPAHQLRDEHRAWLSDLLPDELKRQLDYVQQAGYVAWHHQGLQVLRLRSTKKHLEVAAGVQYKGENPRDPKSVQHSCTKITGPLRPEHAQRIRAVVAYDVEHGSKTVTPIEHRLQATFARMHRDARSSWDPLPLGLTELRREFPAFRAPERHGFIDFLGIDANGELHVVETKVGHDPKVLLQALDYAIWVKANQKAIRQHLGAGWEGPEDGPIRLDLVLAGSSSACAVNPYLPGQITALAPDIPWRIFAVKDPSADPLGLVELHGPELWRPVPGLVAQPIGTGLGSTRAA